MWKKFRKPAAVLLSVVMLIGLMAPVCAFAAEADGFTDVPDTHWGYNEISLAVERGLMSGVSATKFSPGGNLSRAMLAVILSRVAQVEVDDSVTAIADVPAGKWYTGAVNWAVEAGVMTAASDDAFLPDEDATREELIVALANVADYAGVEIPQYREAVAFTDEAGISAATLAAARACQQANVLQGREDGSLDPSASLTRAEVAALVVRFSAVTGLPAHTLDARDYAGQWEHRYQVQPMTSGNGPMKAEPVGRPVDIEYYALEGVVYCANPTNPELQILNIYVPAAYMKENADGTIVIDPDGKFTSPTGETYTAKTAPIVYFNSSSGYGEMAAKEIGTDRLGSSNTDIFCYNFLEEGFVFVGPGGRGSTTKDAAGNYTGKLPASAVDLKAGVRFLRYNDEYLPGDVEKIISISYSSGGSLSAVLGAEGNSPYYDPYLEQIGAADARDDVYAAVCYAPLSNVDVADLAYEWFLNGCESYTVFTNLGGGTHAMDETPFYQALSDEMYGMFVEYVRELGLDLGEDGHSGAFYEGFLGMYEEAIGDYVALNFTTDEEINEFLDSIDPDRAWLVWNDESKTAQITSLDAFTKNHLKRVKWVPSMDTYDNLSNEGPAFGLPDGTLLHFSSKTAEAIGAVLEAQPEFWGAQVSKSGETILTEEYYQKWLSEINDGTMKEISYMLTPLYFIINDEDCTIAPYWRFRTGSEDADHGAIIGWLTAQALEKYCPETSVTSGIIWGMPHCAAEYPGTNDLMLYIHEIAAK